MLQKKENSKALIDQEAFRFVSIYSCMYAKKFQSQTINLIIWLWLWHHLNMIFIVIQAVTALWWWNVINKVLTLNIDAKLTPVIKHAIMDHGAFPLYDWPRSWPMRKKNNAIFVTSSIINWDLVISWRDNGDPKSSQYCSETYSRATIFQTYVFLSHWAFYSYFTWHGSIESNYTTEPERHNSEVNSLALGRYGSDFENLISEHTLRIQFFLWNCSHVNVRENKLIKW